MAALLKVACRRSREEGLRNVKFELGDAQSQVLPAAHFDVMFFADPIAAFTSFGQSKRPGSRLVLMVWQPADRNEWATGIPNALTQGTEPCGAAAFSLANSAMTKDILTDAEFNSVELAKVHEPVFYGPDIGDAYDAVVCLFTEPGDEVDTEPDGAGRQLNTLLESHLTSDGVPFDSRAWVVTAPKL